MSKNVNNDVSKDSPIHTVGSYFEIALNHKIKHGDNIVRLEEYI